MRYRALGRTGLNVSELAVASCGGGDDPGEAAATLAHAFDRGINTATIDAADAPGLDLLGAALSGRGDIHVIARPPSLVRFDLPSPHVPAHCAYPGAHLRAETERLLAALGIERLALLQLHAWCPEWREEGDWLETLQRLRDEGKIAGFGVSLFDHDIEAGVEVVADGAIDAVELMYNIFDPAGAALFPRCQAQGIGVVVRAPLYYGALATGAAWGFANGDWRSAYFYDAHRRETADRVRRLEADLPPDQSVAGTALRFCLGVPALSTIAVGMRTRAQVEANLQAIAAGPLDTEHLAALSRHKWLI